MFSDPIESVQDGVVAAGHLKVVHAKVVTERSLIWHHVGPHPRQEVSGGTRPQP